MADTLAEKKNKQTKTQNMAAWESNLCSFDLPHTWQMPYTIRRPAPMDIPQCNKMYLWINLGSHGYNNTNHDNDCILQGTTAEWIRKQAWRLNCNHFSGWKFNIGRYLSPSVLKTFNISSVNNCVCISHHKTSTQKLGTKKASILSHSDIFREFPNMVFWSTPDDTFWLVKQN